MIISTNKEEFLSTLGVEHRFPLSQTLIGIFIDQLYEVLAIIEVNEA
jgi:hypothetical protein